MPERNSIGARAIARRFTIWRTGRALGFAALVVGVFLPLFALPPLQTGIWYQSEGPVAALHACGGAAWLSIVLMVWARPHRALPFAVHPAILAPVILGLWSLLSLPFVRSPVLSLLGAPQLGEGIAWYFDIAGFVATANLIARNGRLRHALGWFAIAGASLVTAVTALDLLAPPYEPISIPDYLAFHGLALLALVPVCFRPRTSFGWGASLAPGIVIIALSDNFSAVVISVAVAVAWFTTRWVYPEIRSRAHLVGSAACVLVPLILAGTVYGTRDVGTTNWIQIPKPVMALKSRALHYESALASLSDEQWSWAFGMGWGRHSDLVIARAPLDALNFRSRDNPIVQWDALQKDHFHSHNFALEALIAAGLPGLILALLWMPSVVLTAARRFAELGLVYGVALSGLVAVWFMFGLNVPFVAIAAGALLGPTKRPAIRLRIPVMGVASVLVLLQLGQSIVGYVAARDARATLLASATDMPSCSSLAEGWGVEGIHLAQALRSHVAAMALTLRNGETPSDDAVARLSRIVCGVLERPSDRTGLVLLVAALMARSDLSALPQSGHSIPPILRLLGSWEFSLLATLERAPRRTDLAIPYLIWRLDAGDDAGALRLSKTILGKNRSDPIGLWFSGLALAGGHETRSQGLAQMRRALKLGIDRLIPIDDRVIQNLQENKRSN